MPKYISLKKKIVIASKVVPSRTCESILNGMQIYVLSEDWNDDLSYMAGLT